MLLFILHGMKGFSQDKLFSILSDELQREYRQLQGVNKDLYYGSYRVDDIKYYRISSTFGVISSIDSSRQRIFTPTLRIGTHQLDNTHGGSFRSYSGFLTHTDDADLLRLEIWKMTDVAYKNGTTAYEQILTQRKVRVAEEDTAADFSPAKVVHHFDPPLATVDYKPIIGALSENLKKYTGLLKQNHDVLNASALVEIKIIRKYFVDSEGSRIIQNSTETWQMVSCAAKAADGMELPLYKLYFSHSPESLPNAQQVMQDVKEMSAKLSALRVAPVADPFVGPAILSGRSSGVFFHEIFGHRLEGKRMKSENDGQTFKNKIGSLVLPSFLTITIDPTVKTVAGNQVNGFFKFDDEGVAAEKVLAVQDGILKNFLMTRTPINGVEGSNGHARTAPGGIPESRQSNLIVESKDKKTLANLRNMLIETCKRQGRSYGYLFQDVQGGFTNIGRTSPNAFNVLPTEVYRIYVDGRPDELVRGVDLIGTPLSMFDRIKAAGTELETFNGTCGAGSGWVPVSASSPAIFVEVIETQKKSKSNEKLPVLPRPDLDTSFQ